MTQVQIPKNLLINLEGVASNYTKLTFNLPDEDEIQLYDTTIEEQDRTQSDLELDLYSSMVRLYLSGFPVQSKEVWITLLSKADILDLKSVVGLDNWKKFEKSIKEFLK